MQAYRDCRLHGCGKKITLAGNTGSIETQTHPGGDFYHQHQHHQSSSSSGGGGSCSSSSSSSSTVGALIVAMGLGGMSCATNRKKIFTLKKNKEVEQFCEVAYFFMGVPCVDFPSKLAFFSPCTTEKKCIHSQKE